MMDPGEIRVDRFGNRFGYLPGTGRVTERWLGLSEEERKDDWRHYLSTCSSWARGASRLMGVAPLQMMPGKRCTGLVKCPCLATCPTIRCSRRRRCPLRCEWVHTDTPRHTHTHMHTSGQGICAGLS